jgi:hypothetical protein
MAANPRDLINLARVSVTSTGLTLVSVNAGVKTTNASITFAGNVSITALAAAVNALGSGWSAQIVGDSTNYGSWPSADLYWPAAFPTFEDGTGGQGALQCVAGSFAELKMHTYELAGYQWDSRGWLLRAIPYTDPELLHPEDLVWPVGINNLRIQYTASPSAATTPRRSLTATSRPSPSSCPPTCSPAYWNSPTTPRSSPSSAFSAVVTPSKTTRIG